MGRGQEDRRKETSFENKEALQRLTCGGYKDGPQARLGQMDRTGQLGSSPLAAWRLANQPQYGADTWIKVVSTHKDGVPCVLEDGLR